MGGRSKNGGYVSSKLYINYNLIIPLRNFKNLRHLQPYPWGKLCKMKKSPSESTSIYSYDGKNDAASKRKKYYQ